MVPSDINKSKQNIHTSFCYRDIWQVRQTDSTTVRRPLIMRKRRQNDVVITRDLALEVTHISEVRQASTSAWNVQELLSYKIVTIYYSY
jgi:hypothetical protein